MLICSVYIKTSNSIKNRHKIFEHLSAFLGASRDSLLTYTQKITIEPVDVKKYMKSGTSPQTSVSSVTSSPQHHNMINNSFTVSGAANISKSVKQSSMLQAMNLSTSGSTSSSTFSEGLAGKLLVNQPNDADSQPTTKTKSANQKMNPPGSINTKLFNSKSNYVCVFFLN